MSNTEMHIFILKIKSSREEDVDEHLQPED